MTSESLLQSYKNHLFEHPDFSKIENINAPISHYVNAKGKNLRALLVLIGSLLKGGEVPKNAFDLALAVEMFHNFTLAHDDIMDKSDIRRGQQTIHKKWNTPIGILSGDFMLLYSYKLLLRATPPEKQEKIGSLFVEAGMIVCEGQQRDMDNEDKRKITVQEYMKCIFEKTAVLISTALKMGFLLSYNDEKTLGHLTRFGENFGIAFQLQDDFLDVFGKSKNTGKMLGNDILTKKKTIVTITAEEEAKKAGVSEELSGLFSNISKNPEKFVQKIIDLYKKLNIEKIVRKSITQYYSSAQKDLSKVPEQNTTLLKHVLDTYKKRIS